MIQVSKIGKFALHTFFPQSTATSSQQLLGTKLVTLESTGLLILNNLQKLLNNLNNFAPTC